MRGVMMWLAVMMLAAGTVAAQSVEFAYSGRVKADGQPFDGTGAFKFSIVTEEDGLTLWSNDGVTLNGDEPTSTVQVPVTNGYFSVTMGNEALPGMAALDPVIFNMGEKLNLRVWFNDGKEGFHLLSPDRPITNPALIGMQNEKTIMMYVDPVNGKDENPGSSLHAPKQTIQAAWDALPPRVLKNVVLQLKPGVYYESAVLTGKQVANGASITVRGDELSSDSVIVSGALNRQTSTTAVRENVLLIADQRGLKLEDLRFENALQGAVSVTDGSSVEIKRCKFLHSFFGLQVLQYSRVVADQVLVDNAGSPVMVYGVMAENSYLELSNAQVLGSGRQPNTTTSNPYGVLANFCGSIWLKNVTIFNWGEGVHSKYSSMVNAMRSGNVIRDCPIGAHVIHNANIGAFAPADGRVSYQNVTTPVLTGTGGISDN